MSRNVSGVYSLPPGSTVVNGATSTAADINTPIQDLETDMNTPRPVVAGGTGADNAADARTALDVGSTAEVTAEIISEISGFSTTAISSATPSVEIAIPSDWSAIEITVHSFEPSTTGQSLRMQVGENGTGGAFKTDAAYSTQYVIGTGVAVSTALETVTSFIMTPNINNSNAVNRGFGTYRLSGLNTAGKYTHGVGVGGGTLTAPQTFTSTFQYAGTGEWDAIKVFSETGNIEVLEMTVRGVY